MAYEEVLNKIEHIEKILIRLIEIKKYVSEQKEFMREHYPINGYQVLNHIDKMLHFDE